MSDDPDKTIVNRDTADPDETVFSPSSTTDSVLDKSQPEPEPSAAVSPEAGKETSSKSIGIGSVINNRFVIEKVLGEGGMGVVYRALDKRQEEAQDRDPYVAVKILGKNFETHPQAFIALQRETRKSQTLAHPNIITVYDFDRDGETVYMTMEELKGRTLDTFIRENPQGIEPKLAVQIIKSIAEGLAYAHSKNIVHSDLKPGNVFITEENAVKVLDFGIARAVSTLSEGSGEKTLFDAQELGGLTPTYASCEMFEGQDPDPSDDIFALGLIAYELLTGSHPYRRTPANKALAEGLTVRKIKGIKGYQAKALLDSVALGRKDRIADAEKFLARFNKTPTSTKALIFGSVFTLLIVSPLIFLMPNNEGPEIPFEDLPPETQSEITSLLDNGNEAVRFGDYNGALFFFNEAYDLHPRNPDAVAGLNSVVDLILDSELTGSEAEILEQRLGQVESLLDYPALAEDSRLLELQQSISTEIAN